MSFYRYSGVSLWSRLTSRNLTGQNLNLQAIAVAVDISSRSSKHSIFKCFFTEQIRLKSVFICKTLLNILSETSLGAPSKNVVGTELD